MIYKALLLFISLVASSVVYGQRFDAPLVTVKTNMLSASAGTINAAVEFVIRRQRTLDDDMTTINLPFSYNPFTFSDNKKIRHIAFQPELRVHRPVGFGNAFLGVSAIYAYYNAGGVHIPFKVAEELAERRFQGQLFGGGITGGYYLKLGYNIGLEGSLGGGYVYMDHVVYKCKTCGTKIGEEKRGYVGLTKAAFSLVYTIR
jgi:hypothetical protein